MSEPTPSPLPYRVIPSARVVHELDAIMRRAYGAGHGLQALAALKEETALEQAPCQVPS